MASGRSPFDVSSAIVVVMVRVNPSIFPPTIINDPTSAAARQKPASNIVTRLKRASHKKSKHAPEWTDTHRRQLVTVFHPEILDGLPRKRCDNRQDEEGLRNNHCSRRKEDTKETQWSRTRQQQKDSKPN